MKRSWLGLALLVGLASPRVARADDPGPDPLYACKAPPANQKLSVLFKPETDLRDLTTWVMGFTCKNVIFSSEAARVAPRITVMAPKQLTPKQAIQLFVDSVEATGLVVVQKSDTFIIKLGPSMKGCADLVKREEQVMEKLGEAKKNIADAKDQRESEAAAKAFELVMDKGIQHIDDSTVTVNRAVVDAITANPALVAQGARLVPAVKNGKLNGFKIYALAPSSIYARINLKNGDTILAVNGQSLDSAGKALEIYDKIRSGSPTKITIDISRANTPKTLMIAVSK